jgi:5-methylcytosine-specific restriction endonuclease McrA
VAESKGDKFKREEIFERDRWVCQICYKKVNKKLAYPHPMSPSIDHIMPISWGGSHTKDNVQLAHLSCNVNLGVGGKKQMRMFG